MKWLILLFLLACGKHETPKAPDLFDRDGDQIIDGEENGIDKFIAQFEQVGRVSGSIKIFHDSLIEIPFSNNTDLKEKTFDVLVSNPRFYRPEDYFSDWSKISLSQSPVLSFPSPSYSIHLNFDVGELKPDGIELITGKVHRDLGEWAAYMKLSLKANEVADLLSGKAYLNLKKNFIRSPFYKKDANETIKEKSYRVFYFDGEKSSILYISKLLPWENFLEHLNIQNTEEVNDDQLFFSASSINENKWYMKTFKNGDKALAYAALTEMKTSFLKRFTYKKMTFNRNKGLPTQGDFNLSNIENAKVYLRVRSLYQKLINWRYAPLKDPHLDKKCINERILKVDEPVVTANQETIIQSLGFSLSGQAITQEIMSSSIIESNVDNSGLIWELKIENAMPSLSINILPIHISEYLPEVRYDIYGCNKDYPKPKRRTYSPERSLTIEVESYVEKTE